MHRRFGCLESRQSKSSANNFGLLGISRTHSWREFQCKNVLAVTVFSPTDASSQIPLSANNKLESLLSLSAKSATAITSGLDFPARHQLRGEEKPGLPDLGHYCIVYTDRVLRAAILYPVIPYELIVDRDYT